MKKTFMTFIVLMVLAGCSSNKLRLAEDKSDLTLKVSEEVGVLEDMFYSDMQNSVRGGV